VGFSVANASRKKAQAGYERKGKERGARPEKEEKHEIAKTFGQEKGGVVARRGEKAVVGGKSDGNRVGGGGGGCGKIEER